MPLGLASHRGHRHRAGHPDANGLGPVLPRVCSLADGPVADGPVLLSTLTRRARRTRAGDLSGR